MLRVNRKGYEREDGTRVARASFLIKDRGAPGRGNKLIKIEHEGTLGGSGFFNKSEAEEKRILGQVVREKGKPAALGTLRALQVYNKRVNTKISRRAAELARYVQQQY